MCGTGRESESPSPLLSEGEACTHGLDQKVCYCTGIIEQHFYNVCSFCIEHFHVPPRIQATPANGPTFAPSGDSFRN